jgi:rare lipoprotein A
LRSNANPSPRGRVRRRGSNHAGRLCGVVGLIAGSGLLAGCVSPPSGGNERAARTPHPVYKIGAPYEIKGVTYYPHVDYSYDQTGIASWYGEQFDGRYTANGEVFDLNQLTAAHTTLPLPSIVEVTNLRNGRTLRLRINDRGPFVHQRILDVSRRAAQLLGFESAGTAPVRVRIMPRESMYAAAELMKDTPAGQIMLAQAASAPSTPYPTAPRTMPAPSYAVAQPGLAAPTYGVAARSRATVGRYYVQTSGFVYREYAQRAEYAVAPLGRVAIVTSYDSGTPVYRVQVGPLTNSVEAQQVLARIVGTGYPGSRIIVD